MGLNIGDYGYPYTVLHLLRKAALKVENNTNPLSCEDLSLECGKCIYCAKPEENKTKFPAFIQHSDCEGGYISEKIGYDKNKVNKKYFYEWGYSLEELEAECKILNKSIKKYLDPQLARAWDLFYSDVKNCKNDILNFT